MHARETRYARKDRRPLDPPPVVQLKLFEYHRYGTRYQEEKEFESYEYATFPYVSRLSNIISYSDMGGFGILCHIDLFQVQAQEEPADPAEGPNKRRRKSQSRTRPASTSTPTISTPTSASSTPTPSVSSPSFQYTPQPGSTTPHASGSNAYSHFSSQPGTTGGPLSYPPPPPPPSNNNNSVTLPPISTLNAPGPSSFDSRFQLPPMHAPPFGRTDLTLPPLPPGPPPPHGSYTFPPPQPPVQPLLPPPHQLAGQPPPAASSATVGSESNEGKPTRAGPEAPENVLAYLNGMEIREDAKCTEALSGATIAQSQSLEYLGRKVLMFVFSVRVSLSLFYFSLSLPSPPIRPRPRFPFSDTCRPMLTRDLCRTLR